MESSTTKPLTETVFSKRLRDTLHALYSQLFENLQKASFKFLCRSAQSFLVISHSSLHNTTAQGKRKSKIKERDSSPLTHFDVVSSPAPRYVQVLLGYSFCFHHFVITFNAFLRRCSDFPWAFLPSTFPRATKSSLLSSSVISISSFPRVFHSLFLRLSYSICFRINIELCMK